MTPKADSKADPFARESFRMFTPLATRWGDCDMMGHINNVILVRYIESGRLDYLNALLNMDMSVSSKEGIIIADIHVSFLKQVNHPALLDVATRVSRLGNSSLDFESAIYRPGESQPAVTSKATLVWFNYHENISIAVPQSARDQIIQFEGIQP